MDILFTFVLIAFIVVTILELYEVLLIMLGLVILWGWLVERDYFSVSKFFKLFWRHLFAPLLAVGLIALGIII